MTLDKFEYVLVLAEEKSLTKASKRLYISQPGLTSYINKLEQYLGIKLFDRTVMPIQVTDAGRVYISRMKQIRRDEEMLRMSLQDMGSPKRVFRIAIGMSRAIQWLPKILPEFYEMHPNVSLQIHEGGLDDIENGVSTGTYDMAFGALNNGYPGVSYEVLKEEPIYCVVPRSFPCMQDIAEDEGTFECPILIEGSRLNGIRFILPKISNGFYQYANHMMARYNIQPGDRLNLNIMDTAYQLAGSGVGAMFINAADYRRMYPQYDEKLVFCVFEKQTLYRESVIGYKIGSHNSDLIKDLIKIVHEKIETV